MLNADVVLIAAAVSGPNERLRNYEASSTLARRTAPKERNHAHFG
jgi:hypothetical protein